MYLLSFWARAMYKATQRFKPETKLSVLRLQEYVKMELRVEPKILNMATRVFPNFGSTLDLEY